MAYLGIDFGMRHVGFAYCENGISAQPLTTISRIAANSFIAKFCVQHSVKTIVIGMPDGAMSSAVVRFGNKLRDTRGLPVIFWDETLSSKEAQKILIANGVSRKRRQEKEHSVAATLLLQSYIDTHHS